MGLNPKVVIQDLQPLHPLASAPGWAAVPVVELYWKLFQIIHV